MAMIINVHTDIGTKRDFAPIPDQTIHRLGLKLGTPFKATQWPEPHGRVGWYAADQSLFGILETEGLTYRKVAGFIKL